MAVTRGQVGHQVRWDLDTCPEENPTDVGILIETDGGGYGAVDWINENDRVVRSTWERLLYLQLV